MEFDPQYVESLRRDRLKVAAVILVAVAACGGGSGAGTKCSTAYGACNSTPNSFCTPGAPDTVNCTNNAWWCPISTNSYSYYETCPTNPAASPPVCTSADTRLSCTLLNDQGNSIAGSRICKNGYWAPCAAPSGSVLATCWCWGTSFLAAGQSNDPRCQSGVALASTSPCTVSCGPGYESYTPYEIVCR